jgi:hypothetical protein
MSRAGLYHKDVLVVAVLLIRDVYPGSGFFLSRILDATKKEEGKNELDILAFW